jgi:FkbM family methyltransferase
MIPAGLRGKTRLAKALLHSQLAAQDVELKDRYGCSFVVPSLREPIGFHLLIDGDYENDALSFILARLDAGSVFVDVGANIGVFALPVAKKVGPTGAVLAVEASPRVFPYLEGNLKLNQLEHVRSVNAAAADAAGTVPFYEAPVNHFGMGSLAAQFDGKPIPVHASTLDQLTVEAKLSRVDLLKIDVEGFEVKVLEGARGLLSSVHPPLIVFEFCDWAEARVPGAQVGDAQRLLFQLGFSIWQLAEFGKKHRSLKVPLTTGYEMLVALRE